MPPDHPGPSEKGRDLPATTTDNRKLVDAWLAEQDQASKAQSSSSSSWWPEIGAGAAVAVAVGLSFKSKFVRTALVDAWDAFGRIGKYDFESLLEPEKLMWATAHRSASLPIDKNGLPVFERGLQMLSGFPQIKGIHSKSLPLYEELRGQAALPQGKLIEYLERRYRMKGTAYDEQTFLGAFSRDGQSYAAVFKGGEEPITVMQSAGFRSGKVQTPAMTMLDHTSGEARIWEHLKGSSDVLRSSIGRHGGLTGSFVESADSIKIFQQHVERFQGRFPLLDSH